MQITPVNNNQTNFRGDIILKGARKITTYGKKDKEFLSLAAEHIESISSIARKKAEAYDRFAPEMRDKVMQEDNKFKTLIKTITGDKYEVPYTPEEVTGAKKLVWGTHNVVSPEGMDNFLLN